MAYLAAKIHFQLYFVAVFQRNIHIIAEGAVQFRLQTVSYRFLGDFAITIRCGIQGNLFFHPVQVYGKGNAGARADIAAGLQHLGAVGFQFGRGSAGRKARHF
ncbi:hypothetical protein SDC9_201457 [bioreactor metagenome]|uniref:Uncharacterized protein n=1 Tax=bioreactor metagenome TaxID=1076179 RepID=A0A645IR06_9ZZZZ